ncbi:DegT/DnrJ/EryC1/StrS family aminotransferase [Oceanospirillum linum]|uniref:Aminotransferase DegT n=1 Tax=Oceanospirillum linum TaxID=966 RepID=A0A1T1HDZ1_OCELI|nr:aminotransferase class I/II-fold pyridoxal phosphate-dependent enzyme [Oceanospirillum linum]OOV88033.1 hypothetical protein BTA35_0200265 [Oceanospirillum linum]SEF40916.1 dTDP-4-amino-4,6-dideoxygalactose transaminase [Oleiphilus messinensis]SMP00542.1 dTDP-4-amino-4,6-dideoxygalactose transaminase [Oceanospirillum linum]
MLQIAHNRPTLGEAEAEAAGKVIASGWVAQGRQTAEFERQLAAYHGLPAEHVVAVSSGSAALFGALTVLQAEGRRVALPAYACSSLENAVQLAGATPVYLDVHPGTTELNFDNAEAFDLLIHPRLFGLPTRIPDRYKDITIEDCAQALGATLDDRPVGRQTPVSIFSFYATKLITSGGQGGAIMFADRLMADKLRDFIDFDTRSDAQLRFNFQMTDLQAVVGRVQLKRFFSEFIGQREHIFTHYKQLGLPLLEPREACLKAVRFRAIITPDTPETVTALQRHLHRHNVASIIPIETREVLGRHTKKAFPGADYNTKHMLSIPCYPSMSAAELDAVCRALKVFEQ